MAYWVQRSFGAAYAIRARFILKGSERNVSLNEAKKIPAEFVPKEAILESSHKKLPNIFMLSGCWCVNESFRSIIEQYDAEIHQFFAVSIISKYNIHFDNTQYFLLNILNKFDALLVSESNVQWVDIEAGGPSKSLRLAPGQPKLTMSAPEISGRHVWRNEYLLPESVYFSNALIGTFKKHGLKPSELRLTEVIEAESDWNPQENLRYYVDQIPELRMRYRK